MISSDRDWLDSLSKAERVRYFYLPAFPLYFFFIPFVIFWSKDIAVKLWNLHSFVFYPLAYSVEKGSAASSSVSALNGHAIMWSLIYWAVFYTLYLVFTRKLPNARAIWGCLFMMLVSIGTAHVLLEKLGYSLSLPALW